MHGDAALDGRGEYIGLSIAGGDGGLECCHGGE